MISWVEIWRTLWLRPGGEANGEQTLSLSWLTSWSVIEVSGQDAQLFLNGQLSNAIEPDNSRAVLSAWCTPAGRVLYTVWVCPCTPHSFLLLCPTELCAACMSGLQRFVLRKKAFLRCLDDQVITAITVPAYRTAPWHQQYPGIGQDPVGQVRTTPEYTLVSLTASTVLFIAGVDATTTLWTTATPAHYAEEDPVMQRLLVDNGWPLIQKEVLQEQFTPHMLNFDLIDGLSFHKGCYPGQEVVARTQYLGKTKRRSYCYTAPATAQIHIGQAIVTKAEQTAVGQVVVFDRNINTIRLLAVLLSSALSQPLQLADGTAIAVDTLPYAIP